MKDSIKRILRDFPEKHPYLPLGLSIVALAAAFLKPVIYLILDLII